MEVARSVARAFSPLDEELGLVAGALTPRLSESVVRLGTWMPFRRATVELEHLIGARISEATARRLTERAGAAYVEVQEAQVAVLEREAPEAPAGVNLQLLSVDGAMVPLIAKQWTEVKTLALGVVQEELNAQGERVIQSTALSYFSRAASASEFARQALVETHRRGVEKAKQVCAVCDGAEWAQGFIDYHREDAVRVLDFPHAAEHVAAAGRAVFGEQSADFLPWLEAQCHQLKHGSPEAVLRSLRALEAKDKVSQAVVAEQAQYLEKRVEMMRYREFLSLGYVIGSGSVESANKLVVEARLKQAGMHWAREHVNPLVALRNVACNDRWSEAWPQITAHQRNAQTKQKLQRHPWLVAPTVMADPPKSRVALALECRPEAPAQAASVKEQGPKLKYRPSADHPWRRFSFGRGRYQRNKSGSSAKN